MKYNTADVDGLLGVAFAALRYLEAREATEKARVVRAQVRDEKPRRHLSPSEANVHYRRASTAHRAVISAGAKQSAAMRALKRAAKQLEDAK